MSVIRAASAGDARDLAKVAESTFRKTFEAMNSSEQMDRHCRSSYGEPIQAAEISNPDMLTLLSEVQERLVGFAQLRWGKTPSCVSAAMPGEIQRLYIVDEWHGRGIAQELMRASIDEIAKRGGDVIWLGVWEHNPRAISFYKKFGFVAVGEHEFPMGGDAQRDVVMARPIRG